MAKCELRIIDFNFIFQDNVGLTPSSENVNFPASNLKTFFRAEAWRTSGHFIIDATNNKIDFKESGGGGELTATLTSGVFTPTTLAAEIKTQMEAVGAETYTISFSAVTGQWTIATGGTFLSILTSSGTNTAVSTGPSIGFGVSSDFTGAITYTGFVAIHTEENLVIDLKTAEEIDSFLILFDSREGIKFSEQAVIKLQANATDVWTSPAIDVTLTIDNVKKVISHYFSSDESYRFWRINMVDPKNNNLFLELGTVVLGRGTKLLRSPRQGFKFKKRDSSRKQQNESGNTFFDKRPKIQSLEFNFKLMVKEDTDTFEEIYDRVGTTTPLVVVLDPLEVDYSRNKFMVYGHFTKQLEFAHGFRTNFNSGFRIEESF